MYGRLFTTNVDSCTRDLVYILTKSDPFCAGGGVRSVHQACRTSGVPSFALSVLCADCAFVPCTRGSVYTEPVVICDLHSTLRCHSVC